MHKSCVWSGGSGDDRVISCISRVWSGGSGDDRVISCISRVCGQEAPEMTELSHA